eukprot:1359189-Amorphochlora_amoeboformis.AAC.1
MELEKHGNPRGRSCKTGRGITAEGEDRAPEDGSCPPVSELGSVERLAEANKLSDSVSVEEAVKNALNTAAAEKVADIVRKAKLILASESAGRAVRAKGADLIVATERALSSDETVKKLSKITDTGFEKLNELATKGEMKKATGNIMESTKNILSEIASGKGLSSTELKKWAKYVKGSDSDKVEILLKLEEHQIHDDPNLKAILEKVDTVLKSDVAVNLFKAPDQKKGIETGAEFLLKTAESLVSTEEYQLKLKEWAKSGLSILRTATADKVYVINKGFKFHVRSQPDVSSKYKNGVLLRSGDMFTVRTVSLLYETYKYTNYTNV